MIRVITGPVLSGKTHQMIDEIKSRCDRRQKSRIIVPESFSHHYEVRLLKACGNSAAAYAGVNTLSRLSRDIIFSSNARVRTIDRGAEILIMHRAFSAMAGQLTYYTSFPRPQLMSKLLETVTELKSCGISPAEFAQCVTDADAKMQDISRIYSAFEASQTQIFPDVKDLIEHGAERIRHSTLFDDGSEVFIDGFSGFSGQVYKFIEELSKKAIINVYLLSGPDSCPDVFLRQDMTRLQLRALCRDTGQKYQHMQLEGEAPRFEPVARGLFDYKVKALDSEGVTVYSARSTAEECEITAAKIRQIVLSGESRLRNIAIIAADLDLYGDFLHHALNRYGIPVFLSRAVNILRKPPVQAVTAALDAICDNMSRESMIFALKSSISGMEQADIALLENYSIRWNINGRRWLKDFTLQPPGLHPAQDGSEELAHINELRRQAAAYVEDMLQKTAHCRTCGEYAEAVFEYMQDTGLEQRIENRVQQLRTKGELRLAAEYTQLYTLMCGCLDNMHDVLGHEGMDISSFTALFKQAVSAYSVDTIPISLDMVQASDFDRLENDGLHHLFILGAGEGSFPKIKEGAGIFTSADRTRLEEVGLHRLNTQEEASCEELSYIYRAFASPKHSITVTFPVGSAGEGGRESYLISRMMRLMGIHPQSAGTELAKLSLIAREPAFESACASAENRRDACGAAAYEYYRPKNREFFNRLGDYVRGSRGPIGDAALVSRLYGGEIRLTASRAEQASACRFSYFMQYGMRAKKLEPASFSPMEAGSFIHDVVEKSIKQLCQRGGELEETARLYSRRYLEKALPLDKEDARFQGIYRRVSDNAVLIVRNVWEELKSSRFAPMYFELSFSEDGDLPPLALQGAVPVKISGKIDRVDCFEHEGKLFFRVIDYKTGTKDFKLSDILYGLNLQMFLYLLMLKKSDGFGGGEMTIPAGALYIPAKTPYIPTELSDTEEVVRESLDKELRRFGLILSDTEIIEAMEQPCDGKFRFLPVKFKKDGELSADSAVAEDESMDLLLKRVQENISQIAGLISEGDIEAVPYRTGRDFTICQWCNFREACHFDPGTKKDRERFVPKLTNKEVFKILREGEEHGGI